MLVGAELVGGFPRSERLRKALRRLEEKGSVGVVETLRVLWEEELVLVGVQLGAGLRCVVDPMLDWHDLLRPFVEAWRGVYADGLLRWFDNNFFYRVPVFVEEPSPQRFVLAPRVRSLRERLPSWVGLKVVVPGPYTFAKLSRRLGGIGFWDLVGYLADLLAVEVRKAVEAGASVVQVNEPILGDVAVDAEEAGRAVEYINRVLGAAAGAETILAVEYNVPSPDVYEKAVLEARADYLLIDIADYPDRAFKLLSSKGLGGHGLAAGVLDARSIYLEPYSRFEELVSRAVSAARPEKLLVTPNTGFELIPYRYGVAKARLLGQHYARLVERMG
ncbi:MAG: methylcobalamin--homocysteine methyltransferase [Crenarchaeota archaeon]|nr:methylcobalamin--homocysteine methyltransferase [Thermoproteota archaeon]